MSDWFLLTISIVALLAIFARNTLWQLFGFSKGIAPAGAA